MPEARAFRRAGRGKSASPVRRGESGSRAGVTFSPTLPFAAGAIPRASAATAPIAKVFAMVLRFMIISLEFIDWLFRESIILTAYPFAGTGAKGGPKAATVLVCFF